MHGETVKKLTNTYFASNVDLADVYFDYFTLVFVKDQVFSVVT
jgi:hypothetical protein